ncbi:retrovirus-related pol polyprotein from transposon TNT 1-94 [Tanacetum coccineum]
MFLNMDQLEKQLDKEEFQESGSMAAFKVLETQFQMFIKSRIYLDDEYVVMTRNYFLQYTQLEIPEFHDTLIQHMEYVKKSIDKRALHKREYDSWVNERQMQTTYEKVDTSKALDASLVDTESSGTVSKVQDTSSRSGNEAHADDADIRPIYDEEPMAEVQTTAKINVFATGQHHTEQPEFNNEGEGCEHEVIAAEKDSSEEFKSKCRLRLSWALVHSKRPEDVQRGIAMLEGEHMNLNISGYQF